MISKMRISNQKDKKDVLWVGSRPIGELTENPEFTLIKTYKFHSYINIVRHFTDYVPLASITMIVSLNLKSFFNHCFDITEEVEIDGSDIKD